MYTDTVKELPGCPQVVRTELSIWEFPFLRGAVGSGGIEYDNV
jgi:hypothetical protein